MSPKQAKTAENVLRMSAAAIAFFLLGRDLGEHVGHRGGTALGALMFMLVGVSFYFGRRSRRPE